MNIFKNFSRWYNIIYKRKTWNMNHGQLREYIWTIFPTLVLLTIAVPSIRLLYLGDAPLLDNEPIFTFKVIGHQWFWSYEIFQSNGELHEFDSYLVMDEESIESQEGLRLLEVDNPLVVPVLFPLRFIITSLDVLHSWAVPSLGLKIDAVPGRLNQINVTIKRAGEFYGQCSEICGVNHGFMPIKIIAV